MTQATKIELTAEELKLFRQAFNRTYQVIGDDAQLPEGGSKKDVRLIVEVVLDANYVKSYGGLTDEQYERFDAFVQQEADSSSTKTWNAFLDKMAKIFWYNYAV